MVKNMAFFELFFIALVCFYTINNNLINKLNYYEIIATKKIIYTIRHKKSSKCFNSLPVYMFALIKAKPFVIY